MTVDEMQGYLFSQARPPAEIVRLFLNGDKWATGT